MRAPFFSILIPLINSILLLLLLLHTIFDFNCFICTLRQSATAADGGKGEKSGPEREAGVIRSYNHCFPKDFFLPSILCVCVCLYKKGRRTFFALSLSLWIDRSSGFFVRDKRKCIARLMDRVCYHLRFILPYSIISPYERRINIAEYIIYRYIYNEHTA